MKFEDLELHSKTLQALNNSDQFEVDSFCKSVIDAVKNEQSLIIKSGKGEKEKQAFAIAAVDKLNSVKEKEGTKIIIFSNQDETLSTVQNGIKALQADLDVVLINTSDDTKTQVDKIGEGHTIVLANPERLQSILKENRYIFRHVELLMLDQMDNLISSGQSSTLSSIKKRILSSYTTVMSMETYEEEVKKAALSFAEKPQVNGFGPPPPPSVPNHLSQKYINVPPRMKISTLLAHLKNTKNGNCVIFTNSKRGTDRLYRILKKQRMKAVSLHYKLSDQRRAQRLANFVNGNVQYLLVSDLSAAELDINGVKQVINYDVPANTDEYRYRTALVDNSNNSQIVSLVSKQDQSDINKLQKELGQTPEKIPLPDSVKQKVKERKKKSNKKGKKSKKKQKKEPELPKPTFDQLSGGRSGHDVKQEKGIVNFFKKLFS